MYSIIIVFLLLSYLLGSIPFGFLVGKYLKNIDIREYGSGNIGVANIFRVLGVKCAILVLIGDCLKGFIAVYMLTLISENYIVYLLAGLFAIIGHNWSIFLKFNGGKGIATTYGVIIFLNPFIAIISALIWVTIVAVFKFSALGSLTSVFSMLILAFLFKTSFEFKIFLIIINLLALYRHRSNIVRLIQRKENKVFFSKKYIKKT